MHETVSLNEVGNKSWPMEIWKWVESVWLNAKVTVSNEHCTLVDKVVSCGGKC